jgi:predicted nucleic acid-binding protein
MTALIQTTIASFECALDAHAAVIVTGDGHLLRLHPYRGTEILTAKQFLELKRWEER